MASTIIIYEGDGTKTDFTVPFDYLKKSFVTVRLGAGTTLTGGDYGDTGSDYYFLDKTTIRLKVAPASGEALTIRRHTSATERVVTFKDASILKATDLDTSQVQAFHIAEEGRDILEDSLSVNREGNWDAKGKRIINVGDAVSDGDAITYGIYKADALGAHQSKIAAEKARDRAIEAETNSKKSEANAKLSEVKSQASAGTAVSASKHADTVKVENQAILQEAKEIRDENKVLDANTKDNANVAQVKANEAKVSEANAKKSEVNSKESEGNAKVSEGKASASAELAKQWATKLGATVDGSEYSAKYYANKANEVLTQVAADVVNRVTAEGTKQVGLVSNQGTTSVNAVKAQQTASVNAVVTQQGTSVKAVQAQQTTSVNAVTAEGTEQVGLVSTEGTKQVDLAKAQVTLATQSASTATAKATIATQQATLATTKASEAEDSATAASADATKAKASATNAANSASTSTAQATNASNSAKAAKLSADNAALSKTAAGTSEVNAKASEVEAKKQADLAKQYADQAVAGQLQADWAQTNSTKNDFIKNKPTLGTLSAKNSLAYSELTGVPTSFTPSSHTHPISQVTNLQAALDAKASNADLSNLESEVTKDLQTVNTALAGKANKAHTHTVSQITDMPKVVLSVNDITPDDAGNVKVGALPLGHLFAWPFNTPPDGAIQCNGATYNRALYKDFFAYATSKGWVKTEAEWKSIASANGGYCPYYSQGDGSTTFRTPKFAPFMQVAIASADVGKYSKAGLPDIRGSFALTHEGAVNVSASGCFTKSGGESSEWTGNTKNPRTSAVVTFRASGYNSAYGASTTVQPESHEWMICVVVAGQVTNLGSVDVSNVMSAVAQVQADVSAIPTPKAYVTETHVSGVQGYRVWSDGFIEQWGKVTVSGENINNTLTFQKPFKNTNYNIQTASWWLSDRVACVESKTTTSVTIKALKNDNDWYAFGY